MTSASLEEKHEATIADYVGDMVALESHIEEAAGSAAQGNAG